MREYVRPMMMSEAFAPNEYIAACYTLVCAIPGSSATEIGDGTATRYFNGADGFDRYRYTMWDGNRVYADGLAHGNCGMSLLHMMSIIVLAMNITMMAR